MQERSPAEMLGRISSAFRTLAIAGAPLGALLGGAGRGRLGTQHTGAARGRAAFALAVA